VAKKKTRSLGGEPVSDKVYKIASGIYDAAYKNGYENAKDKYEEEILPIDRMAVALHNAIRSLPGKESVPEEGRTICVRHFAYGNHRKNAKKFEHVVRINFRAISKREYDNLSPKKRKAWGNFGVGRSKESGAL
jgi:hypothetical protein